jgi:hypothetical protein
MRTTICSLFLIRSSTLFTELGDSPVSSQMLSASSEEGASGSNASNPNQEAIDHINDAQSALQNGDAEGAQRHLDAAKKALGCSPLDLDVMMGSLPLINDKT